MEEVRSDILTVLANLMDSQSHGMQSSQNNNNNSNPANPITQNGIGPNTNLPDNTQVEATTAQVMNAHLLNMAGQVSSAAVSGSNGSASVAPIVEMERLSALMNSNFPNASAVTTAHNSQNALYEAASQIEMAAAEVGNVLDSRLTPYPSNTMEFTSSQNQAILEAAFNTIDTSTAVSLSAQSYVSLLQQQTVDLWGGQAQGNNPGNFNMIAGSNKQTMGNTRPQSSHGHGNSTQSSSTLDKNTSHHTHSSSTKSAMLIQHSPRIGSSNKGNRATRQYSHDPSMQYGCGRPNNKNRNDLVIPVNTDAMQLASDVIESRGKEKKLTTTPIPSDADKSSCSSTSSGSISGPEHSPDHVTERANATDLVRSMNDSVLMGGSLTVQKDRSNRTIRNMENSKNYPCYGNMNLVNFGTINFTQVMDSSHNGISHGELSRNGQDGVVPVPTSDSVIEIDETVTSPENIPMSPTTPTGTDMGRGVPQSFADMQKLGMVQHGSFTQMQTVSAMQQVSRPQPRKSKARMVEQSGNTSNGLKAVETNNNPNPKFASLSTVTQDNLQDKQKKHCSSKHHPNTQRQDEFRPNVYGSQSSQFNFTNMTETSQASRLKPKVNADPTIRLKQNYSTPMQNHRGQVTPVAPHYSTCKQVGSMPNNSAYSVPGSHGNGIVPNTAGTTHTPVQQGSGQPRQWQTVTAVQGPKLPPVLSEQDRIPKRGRPSKKMMQQNLKVKKNNTVPVNSNNIAPVVGTQPPPQQHAPPQSTLTSSNLVSTYTINEKGLMEEISPKPKENRRSKERTQAFLKYLDDIKISSKNQQQVTSPKPGNEKEKGNSEKPRKKSSRTRSKVFGGRQNTQALTESGITQTMCTFSALAQQFKISNSILERATENLLKSAASKKSKEQQQQHSVALMGQNQQLTPQQLQEKNNDKTPTHTKVENKNVDKGVSMVSSHCETKSSNSTVQIVPTIRLPGTSLQLRNADNRPAISRNASTPSSSTAITTVSQSLQKCESISSNKVSTAVGPKVSASVSSQQKTLLHENEEPKYLSSHTTLADARPETIEFNEDDLDNTSVKGKHKKKKHKKHKKHKYPDSGSGKKKKKDKERKKKSKKKMKTKLAPSIIPSSSISLVKPATKPALTPETTSGSRKSALEINSRKESISSPSSFRHTESIPLSASSWQHDDTTYDAEDSSSDENCTSPKSFGDATSEPFSTPMLSTTMSSFAQYSGERFGFGTFSIPVQKSPTQPTKAQKGGVVISSNAATPGESTDTTFGSQALVRTSKKHSKHKKNNKKLFRKSKVCDPAFLAILDGLLVSLKEMKLDPSSKELRTSHSSANIFLSTSVADTVSMSLWRSPPALSTSCKPSSNKVTARSSASSLFPKDSNITSIGGNKASKKSSDFQLRKSKNSASLSETGDVIDSTSVFCRSPFFQKYGYVTHAEIPLPAPPNQLPKASKVGARRKDNKKVHESSKKSTQSSLVKNATPLEAPNAEKAKSVETIVIDSPKKLVSDSQHARRKRGWPRGKPRGPRSKKGKFEDSKRESISSNTRIITDKDPPAIVNDTSGIQPSGSREKTALERKSKNVDDQNSSEVSASLVQNEDDPTGVVDASLLQQIKQAIEANLPQHPSVNKDAIAKSVDAAVQSYLQSITKSQEPSENGDGEKNSTKTPERRPSRAASSEGGGKPSSESSPKTNTDIHPKKLWACKHQDTESSTTSKPSMRSHESVSPLPKKRGPGRPRKTSVTASSRPKRPLTKFPASGAKQGKVPTASATVVPTKRKVLTVRIQGKCVKPAVKRLLDRAKTDVAKREPIKSKSKAPISTTITKDAALSCLSALCSIKAAKVLAKSGDKENFDVGLYANTDIDEHINEAVDNIVSMYSWDNYKGFEEACLAVEKDMGFVDESDASGENKPKSAAVKKSIESVVAKLKNKQAQNMHGITNALHELHNASSHEEDDENVLIVDGRNADSCEKYRLPGRHQDIYEKVSSYKKDSFQSSKLHKVKPSRSIGASGASSLKRPRGRPRKQADDPCPPNKRQKTNSESSSISETTSRDAARHLESLNKKAKGLHWNNSKLTKSDEMDPTLSPRKPYLEAGLYSSTFKKDLKSSKSSNLRSSISSDDALRLRPRLPAPFDAGLYLRNTLKDFQLPYNIWWMYKHEKISPSQDPSNNFVKISENVYVGPTPAVSQPGDHVCSCDPALGEKCGKQCLNRSMCIECEQSSCPCGTSCSNRAIQTSNWCESLERFKTKDRGWGIRTTQSISEGTFILEYVGEVVSETEFRTRTIELYHAYNNHYCIQLDATTVIDGYRMANEGRFVNHSCEPNCEMQKWCVNGEHRIGLFALREIRPDEELTYDYNFHAYNIDTQQICRCGSQKCRGFIGGRIQRSPSSDSDNSSVSQMQQLPSSHTPKVHGKRSKLKAFKSKDEETTVKEFSILQMKPISKRDKEIIRSRQLFLLRNLSQVRRKEEEQRKKVEKKSGDSSSSGKSSHKSKPKKSHQSREEREKVEAALTEMYTAIATCKDQNGVSVAIPFMNLPSKKKNPEYYERISDPIDLSIIERNIVSNHYKDIETFNRDVQRVFKNAEKYHGKKSTLGKDVFRLRKAYANARGAALLLLNGHKKPTKSSEVSDEDVDETDENIHRKNEDHIRCICCIYKDEGVMVQCEKCYVWQHCDCMGVNPDSMERYLCEECDPRPFSREVKVIPPPPGTPPGHTYYLTLLRDDLLVKQGDCAYLMRDHRLRHSSNSPSVRASHRNLSSIPQDKLDIFRIDQLWTDERGDKYAHGYHFLRPHETHHAPSRTFYHNELFASPFYEIIPLEAVVGLCCVMDLYTYCKGKPKEFKMSDIYICDFRTDKAASSFTRITKKRYPICTKPHVFDTYKHKLCPKKDFQPHQVPEQYKRSVGRPRVNSNSSEQETPVFVPRLEGKRRRSEDSDDEESQHKSFLFEKSDVGSAAWKKRQRLDGIAHRLLSKLPKQAIDVSYLLEPGSGRRHRKKTQVSLESLSQQK